MAKNRKRKRRLKPFTKGLLVIIPILLLSTSYYEFIYKENNSNNITINDNKNNGNNTLNDNNNEEIITSSNDDTIPEEIASDDYIGILEYKATKDYRYKEIVANKDIYPEKLLEMLSRNNDMISYMYDYEDKEGHVYIDNVGKVTTGEYPLLLQYDKKWGYGIYGDRVIAINGCGPTAIAMVVAGLTGRNDVTPYTVAKYSYDNGYYTSEWGTRWDLMTIGAKYFGIVGKTFTLTKENLFNELNNGHPVITSMRPGDFTTIGHFILLTGVEDGKIKVNDPNSKIRSAKLWDYDVIAPQIKGQWSFSLVS